MKQKRGPVFIVSIFVLLISYFIISWFFFRRVYLHNLFEDRYLEWAQFYFLAFTSVLCLRSARDAWHKEGRIHFFYIFLGLICAAVAIEELSWGQRLFGLDSPRFFLDHNAQGETDFHNILGEYLAILIDYTYLLGLSAIVYGFGLPILVSRSSKIREILRRFYIEIPPQTLIIGFLSGGLVLLWDPVPIEEIGELLIYMSLFYMVLGKRTESINVHSMNGKSVGVVRNIVIASGIVLACTVASTALSDLRTDGMVAHYHWVYGDRYYRYGFIREAEEQFEKARRIESGKTLEKKAQ